MSKRKIIAAALSLVTSGSLMLGGTMAWQSINQEALNEVSGIVNPGGRLHDDFNGENKDVYVENFADEPIFARIRLDEYLEFGGAADKEIVGLDVKPEISMEDTSSYITYTPAVDGIINSQNIFRQYVDWDFSGSTVYMPTFNKNKDSLAADVNGSYAENFQDYVVYEVGDTKQTYIVKDIDANDSDELHAIDINYYIKNYIDFGADKFADNVETKSETHIAEQTPGAFVITMDEWIKNPVYGDYWVYDVDGWAYYAKPIEPGESSGLFMDSIKVSRVDDDYYYAVNVVAQFVTAGDMGNPNDNGGTGSGFYDSRHGKPPSENALKLLRSIGAIDGRFSISVSRIALNQYKITPIDAVGTVSFQLYNATDAGNWKVERQADGTYLLILGDAESAGMVLLEASDEKGSSYEVAIDIPENYQQAESAETSAADSGDTAAA